MKVENIREINTTALAYMGDAVYELAVREEMMKQGYYDVNRLHHIATLYVRASAQAKICLLYTSMEASSRQETSRSALTAP